MKIAYIHTGDWPSDSPSITFSTYNCLALSKQTSQCYFFIKQNSQKPVGKIFRDYFDVEKSPNLIVDKTKKSFLHSNRLYHRQIYPTLKKLIEKGNLDAIISRNVSSLPLLLDLKRKYNVKVYHETHDFFADLSVRDDIDKKRKKKQSFLERKFIPQLDGLICLQETQKMLYEKMFPLCDIQVFRTGFLKHVRSDKKRKYLVYIGSLDKHKGVDVLLDALEYCQNRPEVLIIGGKTETEIKRIKNKQPLIKITGWVNKKIIHEYLKESSIGILPLRDTFFNRYLTSPLKIFDYYSHGIPIISADLPTTRELILENQTGVFFEADNARHLAAQIDKLLNNDTELTRLRNNIYENTTHLKWEYRARALVKWIDQKKV